MIVDAVQRVQLGEAEVDSAAPVELAFASGGPQRLLVLHARAGTTHLRVFALPGLELLREARLNGEARLATISGSVALLLVGGEELLAVSLADLRTVGLPVRGSIQIVTELPDGQILVGSRGKLEAWNLEERRPTHRISLPLPADAVFGGTLGSGRMLWFASAKPPGYASLFRLSDGKQMTRTEAGGALRAVIGDPATTTVVAAVEPGAGQPVQLVALDLATESRRTLAYDGPVASFCLVGAPAHAVVITSGAKEPVLLPLNPANAVPQPLVDPAAVLSESPADPGTEAIAHEPGAPGGAADTGPSGPGSDSATGAEATPVNDLGERMDRWRSQLRAAMYAAPQRAGSRGERRLFSGEPQSRSRAELYAWGLSARTRTTTPPPPPPQGGRLNDLVVRFKIDTRSKSLLALLYASWLDGDGRTGLPVGIIARVLGNDEEAWIEALAQGRLGRMGWIRSRYGRTRLRPTLGHFLDELTPRIAIVEPDGESDLAVEPPAGPARLQLLDGVELADQLRDLARGLKSPVASIDMNTLPVMRRERALAERLFEARLHGALPVVVPAAGAPFDPKVLEGPALLAIRGQPLPPWEELPTWLPPATHASAEPGNADAHASTDADEPVDVSARVPTDAQASREDERPV